MDERRKESRKKVMVFTPVYTNAGTLLGYLGDLTMQGAMVISERCLETDLRVILSIQLPTDLFGIESQRMIIPARVARCVPDEHNPKDFHIGFEFTEVTPENEKIIKAILKRYHFRHFPWREA